MISYGKKEKNLLWKKKKKHTTTTEFVQEWHSDTWQYDLILSKYLSFCAFNFSVAIRCDPVEYHSRMATGKWRLYVFSLAVCENHLWIYVTDNNSLAHVSLLSRKNWRDCRSIEWSFAPWWILNNALFMQFEFAVTFHERSISPVQTRMRLRHLSTIPLILLAGKERVFSRSPSRTKRRVWNDTRLFSSVPFSSRDKRREFSLLLYGAILSNGPVWNRFLFRIAIEENWGTRGNCKEACNRYYFKPEPIRDRFPRKEDSARTRGFSQGFPYRKSKISGNIDAFEIFIYRDGNHSIL